jgi:cellulose synthase/poly-beta-1,6-N-acetylglucosamine synthase-like glycosyltransferase
MSEALIVLYGFTLLYLFIFAIGQAHLTWLYRRRRVPLPTPDPPDTWPRVTVQLPVYNERFVIERLLQAVAALDYPKGLLEIQVLDDSTDSTTALIEKHLHERTCPHPISLLNRTHRTGYKAGALQEGLRTATGEFIAIFDADFIPPANFLTQTIPFFTNPNVGVVQTRWGHANRTYSWLTRVQAFGLDAHFLVEQVGRSYAQSFINFNGTGGVWRKKCIEDGGGWQADTLTEDLDLSYRAQLRGWKFVYRENLVTPGELPVAMSAIKSQQYRWTKGGAETARKLLRQVWRTPLPWRQKVHASLHLLNATVFVMLLLSAMLSVPMLWLKYKQPAWAPWFHAASFFLLGFLAITWFYFTAWQQQGAPERGRFWLLFPGFLLLSMGLSLHNSRAVLEGLAGKKTPFVRTPKFEATQSWKSNQYLTPRINRFSWIEGLLAVYFLGAIVLGIYVRDVGLLAFHMLLALGFGTVFVLSLRHVQRS